MSKPSFPKNNPFKEALSSLKEDLISSRQKASTSIGKNISVNKGISVKVSANSSISQSEIDELSATLKPAIKRVGRAAKKQFDRPLNPRHRNRVRDEAAIEALRNPLDRLAADPSGKPLVKRVGVNIPSPKPTPTRQVQLSVNQQCDVLKITKIPKPPIPFTWAKSVSKVEYRLNFSSGKQFQPTKIGDEDRDMTIGFDFGTSATKVTIRDQQARRSFAIRFGSSNNLGDYLLPSKIYLDNSRFHLSPVGQEFANLKIKAISSDPSEMDLLAMVAYMGLVIRYARSYFFQSFGASYQLQRFLWRLNVGIPARTAQKFDRKDTFISIAKAALLCSHGDTDHISVEQARMALKNIEPLTMADIFLTLPIELKHSFADTFKYFNEDAVQVIPEIMAQIHGFVRSNLWNDQLNPHILVIDVGAGTVDISLCDVIRNINAEYIYTSKACMVEGLGVSNLVKYRIDKVLDSLGALDDEAQNSALESLSLLEDINYGGVRVPSGLDEMLEGFGFESGKAKSRFDFDFKVSVGQALWSKTVLVASKGSIPGDESWKPFPVFLCGGGSRMDFYREIINPYVIRHDLKAQFDLKKPPQPNDLYGVDAGDEYDRLSVAYGLGYWDLGRFLADFESPEIHTDGDDSPRWSDGFISKDMT
jgi:hypothetical protein